MKVAGKTNDQRLLIRGSGIRGVACDAFRKSPALEFDRSRLVDRHVAAEPCDPKATRRIRRLPGKSQGEVPHFGGGHVVFDRDVDPRQLIFGSATTDAPSIKAERAIHVGRHERSLATIVSTIQD
jgi:hypothetical protein